MALGVIALGLGAGWYLHFVRDIDLSPEGLRGLVAELGAAGPVLLIGIMALRPFLGMPSWIVLAVAGLLFGTVAGTLYGALGGTIGAAIVFWIARVLGRDTVQARIGGALERFDGYLTERGAPWLAAYTAMPISVLSPVFFASGVTSLGFGNFAAATAVGFVPRSALYAFLGQTLAEPTMVNLIVLSLAVVAAIALVALGRRYLTG